MNDWGIRQRALFLALFPAGMIGLGMYAYFTHSQIDMLEHSLLDRGLSIVRHLASASEFGVVTGNRGILTGLTNAMFGSEDVDGIAIRTGDETFLEVGETDLLKEVPRECLESPQATRCAASASAHLFAAPIIRTRLPVNDYAAPAHDGLEADGRADPVGWVLVQISTGEAAQRQREFLVRSLGITGSIMAIALFLAVRVSRQITRPISELTDVVHGVGQGDLSTYVPVRQGGELRTLQSGINAMIAALSDARDEMQGRIDTATARLRLALQTLEKKNRDLEEQRRKAQAASQAKGRFLATMSHEIRTPLTGMIGMLRLLSESSLTREQRDYLHNLDLAAGALRSLIDDILDLARIEAGKLTIVNQHFNLRSVMDQVVLMLAPSAHEKDLEFICDLPGDLPTELEGDPVRLRQVLINLAGNAIKFTEEGQIWIRVSSLTMAKRDEIRLRFEVHDTGIGIPEGKLRAIFESFTQVDDSSARRQGGSGLGTAISKELVELMHGAIGAASTLGKGSLFWFELPFTVSQANKCKVPVRRALTGQSLLLFEPNPESSRTLVGHLQTLGAYVETADTEAAVLERLAGADDYALLIIAENSRISRRFELARKIRANRNNAMRICHLTFFNGTSDPDLFHHSLAKPVTLERLRACMEKTSVRSASSRAKRRHSKACRGLDVLVAEDNAINALVAASYLQRAGHRVEVAESGKEALEALERWPFDIVLMDLRMPGMDGLETTRRWRSQEQVLERGPVPILALTANVTEEDVQECLAAGMNAVLMKPVEAVQLAQTLAEYIDSCPALGAHAKSEQGEEIL